MAVWLAYWYRCNYFNEMAKPSSKASQEPQTFPSPSSSAAAATSKTSEERSPPYVSEVMFFLKNVGISDPNVEYYSSKDFYSNVLCSHLKIDTARRGHVTCFATVKPPIAVILLNLISFCQNYYTNYSLILLGPFFFFAELFWLVTWRGSCSNSRKSGDCDS